MEPLEVGCGAGEARDVQRGVGLPVLGTAFVAAGMRTRVRTKGTGRTSPARPRLNHERVPGPAHLLVWSPPSRLETDNLPAVAL